MLHRGRACHSASLVLQLSAAPQSLAEAAQLYFLCYNNLPKPTASAGRGKAGWGWHSAFKGRKENTPALWSSAVTGGADAPRTLLEAVAHKPCVHSHGWRGVKCPPSAKSWSGQVWTSSART